MLVNWLRDFAAELYFLLSEMAPYLLLGFLFAGLLKAFVPVKGVSRFMGSRSPGSVINAALLGVPLPLCSCGVIPTGVSFYQNGASKGATTSFLISTPQTGVDSILATYSLLGLPLAIIRPIVAFLTGLIGGGLSHRMEKDQWSAGKEPGNQKVEGKQEQGRGGRLKTIFTYGFGELVEDIVKWLVIGLVAAAVLSVLIPDSFFTQYIGNPWLEMTMILVASVPLYVCATGSIPLAAVFLMKGLSPGAALVFLMAGPATNVATMTVVGKTMGRKALLIYLFSIIGGSLLFGTLINELFPKSWFTNFAIMDHEHGFLPEWIKSASTIILSVLIILAVYTKWIRPRLNKTKNSKITDVSEQLYTTIKVEGMTCNHCKAAVENNIADIQGVDSAEVNLADGTVRIEGNTDLNLVEKIIANLGYSYKGKL